MPGGPNLILLSFDVEEFDLPLEYGISIPFEEQIATTWEGLGLILELLEQLQLRSTLFVTANYALHAPDQIRAAATRHEIASHGFYHCRFQVADLVTSKQTLEGITHAPVQGFRMARLQSVEHADLLSAGYSYNSSLNPTYIPGRYNHLTKPRQPHYQGPLLQVPVSVTPLVRFPLFWLSFKNFPLGLIKGATQFTLAWDHWLSLYYHPWEFADLSAFPVPNYLRYPCGPLLVAKLRRYLIWLKQRGEFISYGDYYSLAQLEQT